MRRPQRAALAVLTLASLVLAGVGAVRAADPTLGLAVQTPIILADGHSLALASHSTLTQRVTITPAGGFSADPASLLLAPGATTTVALLGAGTDGTRLRVTFTDAAPAASGTTRGVGTIDATILYQRPAWAWWWVVIMVLVALLALGAVLRRDRGNSAGGAGLPEYFRVSTEVFRRRRT